MAANKNPETGATSSKPSSMGPRRPPNTRIVQNFHLVWLDGSIDEDNNDDCRNSITQLRQIINTVNTFIDVDECIDFITDKKEEKTLMMVSGIFSEIIVPVAQEISQVSSIYIVCENKMRHEEWTKEWPKVKGVYTDISPICQALKQAALDCDQNSVSISFVKTTDGASNQNLDTLGCSFMYTQILKEILLTINFDQIHINEFLTYSCAEFVGNTIELKNIDKIETEYRDHEPIWWYTYNCFLYSMLNRALRTMEVDLIIKMGFFVRDLHNHIAALHAEQFGGHHHSDTFVVYRGQGLSQTDFDQLKQTQGGLLAFNNFLSTSANPDVSLKFARRTMATSKLVGILFILKIDPSISATPFADVGKVSYFKGEKEILFSMHSVFRIGHVKQIDGNSRLWQVDLILTGDNDSQLQVLTESIRKETSGLSGWDRLGQLMIKLGQFNKAEELYDILLKQATDEGEKAHLFHQLGGIKDNQGKYAKAAEFYEKAIKINQKIRPPTHVDLTANYNNIGAVYDNMGEYSKALSYYEKALAICQKTLPANHPSLATSYNNIGAVCRNAGDYRKALSYYERGLDIWQRALPPNHPHIKDVKESIEIVKKKL
jgi:Flp pilus assembly protein TadD